MDNLLGRPEEIRVFLEDLLQEAGIAPEQAELKDEMIDDLETRLQTRLMQVLAENADEQTLETFSGMVEQDPVGAQEFLASKINNLPQLFFQAMAEFREAFLKA